MKTYGRKAHDAGHNTSLASLVAVSGYSSINTGTTITTDSGFSLTRTKELTTSSAFLTPFPAGDSDSGVFKLGTSRPLPVSPGHKFSPVPLAESNKLATLTLQANGRAHIKGDFRLSRSNTTSRRLKENMRPKPSKRAHTFISETIKTCRLPLASPFTSPPPSPVVQAAGQKPTTKLDHESRLVHRPVHRQSLSDSRINRESNPNIPAFRTYISNPCSAPESDSTSPNQGNTNTSIASLANIQRRPSAPSLRHRVLSGLIVSAPLNVNVPAEIREGDGHGISLNRRANSATDRLTAYEFLCGSETYFISSLDGAVDFNRPPSQMSLYGGDIDSDSSSRGFFMHIQGRSTPRFSRSVPPHESLTSRQNDVGPVQPSDKKQYSPWISDSIISPPSYYMQRKDYGVSVAERALEDIDLTLPTSPADATAASASATGGSKGASPNSAPGENSEGSPLGPYRMGPSVADHDASMRNRESINSPIHKGPGGNASAQISAVLSRDKAISRTRGGTVVQSKMGGECIVDRRSRSGTIIQGGGGARRTRSGTIVQATKESRYGLAGEPRFSQDAHRGKLSENNESQDEDCSCRSSDDELMLRSHSHHDLDTEDLEWKVADPPSPVIKRLRKARRRDGLKRQRAKGKKSKPGNFGIVVEEDDIDGVDGDIEDDELDFLGNFVPENW